MRIIESRELKCHELQFIGPNSLKYYELWFIVSNELRSVNRQFIAQRLAPHALVARLGSLRFIAETKNSGKGCASAKPPRVSNSFPIGAFASSESLESVALSLTRCWLRALRVLLTIREACTGGGGVGRAAVGHRAWCRRDVCTTAGVWADVSQT